MKRQVNPRNKLANFSRFQRKLAKLKFKTIKTEAKIKITGFCFTFDSKIYHKRPLIARESPREIKTDRSFQKGLTKNPLKTPLTKLKILFMVEPPPRFELGTSSLRKNCSTTELRRQKAGNGNRTRISSLGRTHFATKPYLQQDNFSKFDLKLKEITMDIRNRRYCGRF